MEKINWERIAAMLFCLLCGSGIVYVVLRFALPPLLPFLIAWAISACIRPMAKKLSKASKLPFKLCAFLLLTVLLLFGTWGIRAAVYRLLTELGGLLDTLLFEDHLIKTLEKGFRWLNAHSILGTFRKELPNGELEVYQIASDLISGCLKSVSSRLPEWIGQLASSMPQFFFMLAVTVISGFYFCMDGERIAGRLCTFLPRTIQQQLPRLGAKMKDMVQNCLKAYLLLFLLTVCLLLIGFWILGTDYAWLLALLVALADLLPIVGVGTVLIPWALLQLLQQQLFTGFGLLILYLIVELVRQAAMPHLFGKRLGLHPLLTLFAGYVGFCLFGLLGMLVAPLAALLAKTAIGYFQNEKAS